MSNYIFVSKDELYHYGVKGMKWGVRRYQNADGTYTNAGRRKYFIGTNPNRARMVEGNQNHGTARKLYGKTSNNIHTVSTSKNHKNISNANSNFNVSKKSYNKSRIDNQVSKQTGKKRSSATPKQGFMQKHKDKLIQSYIDKGYGREAAEIAAKQRMKTELIVGSIAAVSVAVIAKKVGTRIGQDYCDRTFKSGKVIQNIGAYKDATFKDQPFFAAVNRHDKRAYGAMYPNEKRGMMLQAHLRGDRVKYDGIYNNQIKLNTDVKRASVNNARKIFYEQMNKDPDFKKQVVETIQNTGYGIGYDPEKLMKSDPKKFYDRFNQALATPEFQSAGIHKKFYSELEKKGYNAILDINDTRYSGYKKISKDPTIFFGQDNFEKIANKKLSETEIETNVGKYVLERTGINTARNVAVVSTAVAAKRSVSDQKKIEKYLDEHPNSKLSRQEILKLVDKRD